MACLQSQKQFDVSIYLHLFKTNLPAPKMVMAKPRMLNIVLCSCVVTTSWDASTVCQTHQQQVLYIEQMEMQRQGN